MIHQTRNFSVSSPLSPKNELKSPFFSMYRYFLSLACGLASLSFIVKIGFVLPQSIHPALIWLNFCALCSFLVLSIFRVCSVHSHRIKIKYAIFECILITALIIEFFILQFSSPIFIPTRFQLVDFYPIILQTYFLFELSRQIYKAGGNLFLLSFSPASTVVFSFIFLILIGTLGLMLPRSTHGDLTPHISFIDALFTSTSAVCVTGLTVVDTATFFSRTGQSILMVLIQLGAFGIMIFAGLFVFTFGSNSSIRGRIVLQDILSKEGEQRVTSLLRTMFFTTLILESIGASLLYSSFSQKSASSNEAWFNAIFHSVSAFCNAGFSTFSNNLESYSASPTVVLTICLLIVSGGIGFSVIYEIIRWVRKRFFHLIKNTQISLHTLTVIQFTTFLLILGFLTIIISTDWTGRSIPEILLSSLFQSVTPRTAGFNTIPLSLIAPWGLILVMILMFIGGAPGGTAGGIKVSTVVLLFHTSRCLLKRRQKVEIHHRTIGQQAVMSAFVISGLAVSYIAVATIALVWAEPKLPFFNLIFEVISAFGTVGLYLNTTPQLSVLGKLIIITTMFLGRIGPITLFLALMQQRDKALYEYPSGTIVVS